MFYGPTELRSGWRLLIFATLVAALMWVGNSVASLVVRHNNEIASILSHRLVNIASFVSAALVMARLEGRSLAAYGLPMVRTLQWRFGLGALLGFVALSVLLGAMWLTGLFHISRQALHGTDAWAWAALYAFGFIIVGVDEEFRYRGYGLFTLSTGIGFWPAAALLSLVFGATHLQNLGETGVAAANASLGGLVFAAFLRRSGNLWFPIGFHASWDWAQTYFYGVADSGHVLPGHLLESTFSGPGWLTGSTAGPEGSILCTAVLVLLWALVSLPHKGRRREAPSSGI